MKKHAVILIILFFFSLFVNVSQVFNGCARHVCPDVAYTPIVTPYPNFYVPAGGGFPHGYVDAHWSLRTPALNFGIILIAYIVVILIIRGARKIIQK